MTKQCPECKRFLELNADNFRFSCDGFWRKTCLDCQNKRKRYRYEHLPKDTCANPYRQSHEQRVNDLTAKYEAIFKTLEELGVSPDAPASQVDQALEAAQRRAAC